MIRDIKIKKRLRLGFSAIILFVIGMSGLGIYEIFQISNAASNMYTYSHKLTNHILLIKSSINSIHRDMKDVALSNNANELNLAVARANTSQDFIYEQFDAIYDKNKSDLRWVDETYEAFSNWQPIRDRVIEFTQNGDYKKAAAITKNEGARHIHLLNLKIDKLIKQAEEDALWYYNRSLSKKKIAIRFILLILVIILTISVLVTIYLSRSIILPIYNLKRVIRHLAEGNFKDHVNIFSKDEIGDLAQSIRRLKENMITVVMHASNIAKRDYSTLLEPRSEKDELVHSLNKMTLFLRKTSENNIKQNWMMSGRNELHHVMGGNQNITLLSQNILDYIVDYFGAKVGTLYLINENRISLSASYGCLKNEIRHDSFDLDEAILGVAVKNKKIHKIDVIPENYLSVSTSLGSVAPQNILVVPIMNDEIVVGVLELGFLLELTDKDQDFLSELMRSAAVSIIAAQARDEMISLLEKTQELAEELQVQQEELRAANEELEQQTEALQLNSETLKQQQEELRASNEELEEKTQFLEEQSKEIIQKNNQLEIARSEVELKAVDLERVSKYKSEFLANMSHELRTPLNSLLILSRDLAENNYSNLSEKQLQSAEIIHKCGSDLLLIINDILDLSKVEAGHMETHIANVPLSALEKNIRINFSHQCEDKGLELTFDHQKRIPFSINTDIQRVDQILKNLVSNAIKFTSAGQIKISFKKSKIPSFHQIETHKTYFQIEVSDSGIGIPVIKQKDIFDAFKQADGSTSRKYGGTGLGLSISRELARLLGGHLLLESSSNQGSVFSLYLPMDSPESETIYKSEDSEEILPQENESILKPNEIIMESSGLNDNRNELANFKQSILVIEDDLEFAKILRGFCHDNNFGFIHSTNGLAGIEMMRMYKPDGVLPDVMLPVYDGWKILQMIQNDPTINMIPVHMLSASETTIDAKEKGAIGFIQKPAYPEKIFEAFTKLNYEVENDIKCVLLIDDDQSLNELIIELFQDQNINFDICENGKDALKQVSKENYDLIIVDLNLPDYHGKDLVEDINEALESSVPIIIYTGSEVSEEDEFQLRKYTNSIIVKGIKSQERLLDETALFLHEVKDNKVIINTTDQIIKNSDNNALKGKSVLVVDDDMRNIFAVSHVLENLGMDVQRASNGKKAIEILESQKSVDLILMDIMMPVMDGYEAMQLIRQIEKFKNLPIIALTAKAMKGDREKCINSGANDYCAKPLNIDKLLSLIKVWLN